MIHDSNRESFLFMTLFFYICLNKYLDMIFVSYTATDAYYEFIGVNGEKVLMPTSAVIIVDDNSGMKSVKLIASRKTIGTLVD